MRIVILKHKFKFRGLLRVNILLGVAWFIVSCEIKRPKEPLPKALFALIDSSETGVNFVNFITETPEDNHLVNENFVTGAGVAIGDINNDGLNDLYFTGNQVGDRLFINNGNLKFTDITHDAGISSLNTWSTGVSMADVNADGLIDIYVCKNVQGNPSESANLLFINNGDLTFTELAKDYGINDRGYSIQANFFDFDCDGLLDMYLVNQPPGIGNRQGGRSKDKRINGLYSDKLYKNLGGGLGFIEISPVAKTENRGHGLSSVIGDLNNDGFPDIYVTNDYDEPDYLYINQGNGTFKEDLKARIGHISNFSMGSDIADYDNDGNLDLVVLDMVAEDHKRIKTNMGGMNPDNFWKIVNQGGHYQYMFNTLQRNNGNGTFSDLAHIAGISNTDWSWGALFADLDNDGYKDLFITNGIKRNMRNSDVNVEYKNILDSLGQFANASNKSLIEVVDIMQLVQMAPTEKIENYAFKNNGDLTFSKANSNWGFDTPTLSNGLAYGDLDNDGDLELVINNIDQQASIYKNYTVEKGIGNFLRIQLNSDKKNNLIGTRVTLIQNNGYRQVAEISNSRGYMSKSEDVIHFGLGKQTEVNQIQIKWANGSVSILNKVQANQLLQVNDDDKVETYYPEKLKKSRIFTNLSTIYGINHYHQENTFDDFEKQVLLPHKMSNFGPTLSVADINNDGLDDFYLGGAAGFEAALYVQNENNQFERSNASLWENEKYFEDVASVFLDVDNDNDKDLIVVSGGNEFPENHALYQDRLYLNDGKGNFSKSKNSLPSSTQSGSKIIAADYNDDGFIDVLILGRHVPGKYPSPANSLLLENKGGYFSNVTTEKAPSLINLGMATDAIWCDINSDEKIDIVIVGEWMAPTILLQTNDGFFQKTSFEGLEKSDGWYFSLATSDIDNDGDEDLILGNLGLNYKYKASKKEPFQVHSADFDENGTQDIILSYYEDDEVYPLRGRSCSIEQIPELAQKFPSFESFGNSDLEGIYGKKLKEALHLRAFTFTSYYAENINGTKFKLHPLPNIAQVSNINSILIEDYNKDGNKDLLVAGNLFASEIETPRNDAGTGMLLLGDGKGEFKATTIEYSGIYLPQDVKNLKIIKIGSQKNILVASNNQPLQFIGYK